MRIKGSTVIICFMYLTWCAYLALQIWCYQTSYAFLPAEVTYGTAALFISETVSLARLKLAKEGAQIKPKTNQFLSSLGIVGDPGFEQDALEESAKHARKAKENG